MPTLLNHIHVAVQVGYSDGHGVQRFEFAVGWRREWDSNDRTRLKTRKFFILKSDEAYKSARSADG